MGNLSIFFNHRITRREAFTLYDVPAALGDFFLTPVRCLFNGNKITISIKDQLITVTNEKEYASTRWDWQKPKRNFLRVIASIVLLAPGLILGSVIKGLGYLSKVIRARHKLTLLHYIPIDRTVGTDQNRLNLDQIKQQLEELRKNNWINQPTKTLIVYAQPNTQINTDPGFLALHPQKIILVGARIVHQPCAGNRLDDTLAGSSNWESRSFRTIKNGTQANFGTFITQWQVNSVQDAIQDIPPKKSLFSSERYRRVYVV